MNEAQDPNENLKKYQERIQNLPKASERELTIDDLAAEGEKLLKVKTPKKTKKVAVEEEKPLNESNPYVKARLEILSKYPEWKKIEMLMLEKTKNTEGNRHYSEFVKAVIYLGDAYSA